MTATRTPARQQPQSTNGQPESRDTLAQAIAYEQDIADRAAAIRESDDHTGWESRDELPPALFIKLWPLLKEPIPAGFIVTTGVVTGKPYESTGVKSMQVLIDRMNNVLTPLFWGWDVTYEKDGKLARVDVWVGNRKEPYLTRTSWGGVKQGSSDGNIYKGSETNAAKRAFAAVGPAHEIYLGAADFDPDTDEDSAKLQTGGADAPDQSRKLPPEKVTSLKQAVDAAGLTDHLPMKLRSFGVESLEDLTVEQGIGVYEWCGQEVKSG